MMPTVKEIKPVTVLKSLMRGDKINAGGFTYVLSSENDFCMLTKNSRDIEVYLKVENFTLRNFIDFCADMSEEEYTNICAANSIKY